MIEKIKQHMQAVPQYLQYFRSILTNHIDTLTKIAKHNNLIKAHSTVLDLSHAKK
jgi:hypothetical protein